MDVTTVTSANASAQAYIVGVDAKRHAPSLKLLGLDKDAAVHAILDNKRAALAYKAVRTVHTAKGWVVLVGMGDPKGLTPEKRGTLANAGARAAAAIGCTTGATTLLLDTGADAKAAQAIAHGLVIGSLDFDQWKTKKVDAAKADAAKADAAQTGAAMVDAAKTRGGKPGTRVSSTAASSASKTRGTSKTSGAHGTTAQGSDSDEPKPETRLKSIQVILPGGAAGNSAKKALERGLIVAAAVNDARLLANTPPNIANPKWLAHEARSRGKKHGFSVSVKGRDELRKEGFGALCGVAQGSVNEEQLISMEYTPKGWSAKKGKTLVVVGKGVCFDSGGISLKPGDKMWEMKYDKCGACNTIALMTTLESLGVKHRVIGVTPCVENLPGSTAQRPGDIVTAKDGTTIEVLNTDAEGRLILADALTHARTYEPHWIIDMATLTGACDVAVGPTYVAVMSNKDAFAKQLVEISREVGDKAWQLPQGDEYDEANKGTYADLQNISLTNRAGTCIGGSFIKHFAKDTTWGHLDIASKAWTAGTDYYAKGPTGAGLRIVLERILQE